MTPCESSARWRTRATSRSSTRSIQIASRDKKPRPSRSSTISVTRRTFTFYRSATLETSPRIGRAIANFATPENQRRCPAMLGFQAAGAAPIFHNRVVEQPETIASAIRIGNPASWKSANAAIEESRGAIDIVTDDEILEAQRWLARNEGIFVEPASAASIAGLFKSCDQSCDPNYSLSKIGKGSRIVCTVTGHGLKDPCHPIHSRTSHRA